MWLAALLLAAPGGARPVKVVELFQSRDCAGCPDAQTNLNALATHQDVLALSYPVSFRAEAEWAAEASRPEFMARQAAYAESIGTGGVATPQMVLNGRLAFAGKDAGEVAVLMQRATAIEALPRLTLAPGSVIVSGRRLPDADVEIWRVTFSREAMVVPPGQRRSPPVLHRNLVRAIERLGRWRGGVVRLPLPPAPAGLASVVLLQRVDAGPIFAAAEVAR